MWARTRWVGAHAWGSLNLPRLLCVPCFLASTSSLWMRFSRYSCFLPSISSVSRSRARASWGLGAARLLEEPPPLKNLPNLLMSGDLGPRKNRSPSRVPTSKAALPGINKGSGQVTHTPGYFLAPAPRPLPGREGRALVVQLGRRRHWNGELRDSSEKVQNSGRTAAELCSSCGFVHAGDAPR